MKWIPTNALAIMLCFTACTPTQKITRPAGAIYAGIWNYTNAVPRDIIVSECRNGVYAIKGKEQMIKPDRPGNCQLVYRKAGRHQSDTITWQVRQMPVPKVVFMPPAHGIQADSVFYFRLATDHFKDYPQALNGKVENLYHIEYYDYRILDSQDRVVYEGLWTDRVLDCPGTLAVIRQKGKGGKLVVENMSVSMPDGSWETVKVDTIVLR